MPGSAEAQPPPLVSPADWNPSAAPRVGPLQIHTDPGELPHLELATDPQRRLTLEHTHVSAKLMGFVAEVEVTQTYANPYAQPIEAVYVFPLPENSAVNHMRMVIDRRVIEADVRERSQARRLYTQAKKDGYTAALLEQERPNVFTQSVANIEPGKKIDVVVRYLQDLTYDAGAYEFVFPMVVGPRFMPGTETGGPPAGVGSKPDTTLVPDASRISPPYVGRGERSGRTISLELVADPLVAVDRFDVPTHAVTSRRPSDGTLQLALAEKESIPNRDFVLRYRVAEPEPSAALYLSGAPRAGEAGYFSLVVSPPTLDVDALVGRREIVFVVDVSGSMAGTPLALCKRAMREALGRLRPVDTFNVLTFSGRTTRAFEAPHPANSANIREALAIVDEMSAGGGTQMADAVASALGPEIDSGRNRYVFFLTDGYVGNEEQIISASRRFVDDVEERGQRARVFGFGVGSSVNRYLIDGLSRAGQGVAVYVTGEEDASRGVNRFFHYIDRAVLENLRVDWAGLEAEELFPSPLPDLFASHPVIIHGRYRGTSRAPILVHAQAAGRAIELPVRVQKPVPALTDETRLGRLWARQKVAFLEERLALGADTSHEIEKLGLDFHLVTRFTSLVAVDSARRVSDGRPNLVVERLDHPDGVDVAMAGGDMPAPPSEAQGYGYSMEEEGAADEDICRIDPAACPSLDLNKESRSNAIHIGQVSSASSVRSRRGCGCRVPGDPVPSETPLLIAALALGAVLLRRRHWRENPARRSPAE